MPRFGRHNKDTYSWAQQSTRCLLLPLGDDTMLINDQDHNIADFSKTTNEHTKQFGVPSLFESSVLHVSHWWFCSSERKQRKHASGKPLPDREEQKKEKFLRSVLQSWCQRKKSTEQYWELFSSDSHEIFFWRVTENPVLKSLRKIYSADQDLWGHLEWRAQQAVLGENSVQRNNYIWMRKSW